MASDRTLSPTVVGTTGMATWLRAEITSPLPRSEEHTSELQSPCNLVCRLLLEKKKKKKQMYRSTNALADALLLCDRTSHHRSLFCLLFFFFFFFNDTATTEIYTLSLHDALPIFITSPLPNARGFSKNIACPFLPVPTGAVLRPT